jgi:hypothetical protein
MQLGKIVVATALLSACSGENGSTPDGNPGDARPSDASPPDAASPDAAGCTGPPVAVATLRELSIQGLRQFFGVKAGFEGGALYFRDLASSTNDCPSFDQSEVIYAADIDPSLVPSELRAAVPDALRVALFRWGLNGYRYIYFGDRGTDAASLLDRSGDIVPVSGCSVVRQGVDSRRVHKLADELAGLSERVPVEWFDQIGVLCFGPRVDDPAAREITGTQQMYFADVLVIAARMRSHGDELGALVWSNVYVGLPTEGDVTKPIDDGAEFTPDCLRTVTRDRASGGVSFASLSSFPPPFGPGWRDNPRACQ